MDRLILFSFFLSYFPKRGYVPRRNTWILTEKMESIESLLTGRARLLLKPCQNGPIQNTCYTAYTHSQKSGLQLAYEISLLL